MRRGALVFNLARGAWWHSQQVVFQNTVLVLPDVGHVPLLACLLSLRCDLPLDKNGLSPRHSTCRTPQEFVTCSRG